MKLKNTFLLLFTLSSSLFTLCRAQQFWIENWLGTTCASQCGTYTGTNGTWTVVKTGYNGPDSNVWYFSEEETGEGRTKCGSGGSAPATAHVGVTTNSPFVWAQVYSLFETQPDQGAVADDYSGSPSTRTNLRLQSPVIPCTGKSNITLSFNYIEGKSAGNDYATVWYYDGTAWSLLATPPELDSCSSGQGLWTYYSVALPSSANNNAHVQIGFNWTNDTLGYDDNVLNNTFVAVVSFAVDSVVLSTTPTTSIMTLNDYTDSKIYPNPNNGKFTLQWAANGQSSIEIYNVLGEKVYQSVLSNEDLNPINLNNPPGGVYLYRILAEDGTIASEGKFIVK